MKLYIVAVYNLRDVPEKGYFKSENFQGR